MKLLSILLVMAPMLAAEVLYETDFDDFPVGPNNWGGFDGWTSNDNEKGVQTIDDEVLPALLNTATLGFQRPNSDFTSVALNLGYDHVADKAPIVEVAVLLGIEDSTNNRRDNFYLSIYNSNGDHLASILFVNDDPDAADFGIWRVNGTHQFDTYVDFIPGQLFDLLTTIDLEDNTWSADIGGIPLFTDQQFTNTDNPVNLGYLAFEWDISSVSTFLHGDNFLLVADIEVQSVIKIPELEVTHSFDLAGNVTLNWETAEGWDDQVQYSADLGIWLDDLPDSKFDDISNSSPVTFTDESNDKGPLRFYRVNRTPASS